MVLISNKRGVFFVAMALVILSLFVLLYTFSSEIIERKAIQQRIQTMNEFSLSMVNDLEKNVYVGGYRTIFLIEDKIVTTGNYASNINSVFQEAFLESKFDGQENPILLDSSFQSIINSISAEARKMNLELQVYSRNMSVLQDDPYNVKIIWNIDYNLSDLSDLASINANANITSYIPISEFDDPIYLIETGGKISNKFNLTPYNPVYTPSDISNFSNHVANSYYLSSTNAPSFLNRLSGNFSASEYGIESFVNLGELSIQGVSINEKSTLDYVYFSNSNPSPLCTVSGMPVWFRIDSSNAIRYNISC